MRYEWFDQLVCHLLMSTALLRQAPAGCSQWHRSQEKTLLLHCSRLSDSHNQDLRLTVRPRKARRQTGQCPVRERHNRAKGHNYCRSTNHDLQASEDSPARRDGTKRASIKRACKCHAAEAHSPWCCMSAKARTRAAPWPIAACAHETSDTS
jgi:hypothetical protein